MRRDGLPQCYILRDNTPVPVETFFEWAVWFYHADRRVALDQIGAGYQVSTVFMGDGRTLFETAIITAANEGKNSYNIANKYCTWDDAERGHAEIVAACRKQYEEAIKG